MTKPITVAFKPDHLVVSTRTTDGRKVQYEAEISLGCGKIVFHSPKGGEVTAKRITGSKKKVDFVWTFRVGKDYNITAEGPPTPQ